MIPVRAIMVNLGRWVLPMVVQSGCGEFTLGVQPTVVAPYLSITENFEQVPVEARDILWIIDNTGSMEEELLALAPLFQTFIEELEANEIAYQVGITTTDLDEDHGELIGMPWIITPETPEASLVFYSNVTSISPDSVAIEEGLDAALTALSDEKLDASGANYGFMRPDAGLSVIIVSDADDQSLPDGFLATETAAIVDYYASALSELKGGDSSDLLIFSAIVDLDGSCEGAAFGDRYLQMAERLNGDAESICNSDVSDVVSSIGSGQVVLKSRFRLSFQPVEDSLVMWVNYVQVFEGTDWQYNADQQSVFFFSDRIPPYQAQIQAAYRYEDPAGRPARDEK